MKKVLKVLLVLILIVLVGFCYYLLRVKSFDDKGYVYYSNRRSGNNGLFIVSDNIDAILKTNNTYKAKVTLNYNERLK